MYTAGRREPDPDLVAAACTGEVRALDELVAESLPLVYNIVGRALRAHADVDDVVQETMLRVVRSLRHLQDPAAYRSWLVAITVRQVREHEQNRKISAVRITALDAALETADPASDFAGVTILRLGLTDQRRDVAQATRWLDPDDREVLSLWWLEEAGELDRATLAAALDLSQPHAAVRVQRVKERLDTAREVVRALQADPHCQDLSDASRGWDGRPSPLWRKRLARHVRRCGDCGLRTARLHSIQALLNSLPLVPLPASLGLTRILYDPSRPFAQNVPMHQPTTQPASSQSASTQAHSTQSASTSTQPPATHSAGTAHGGKLLHLLHTGGSGSLLTPVAALAGAAVLVAGVVVGVHLTSGPTPSAPVAAPRIAASITPSPVAPSTTPASSPAKPSPSATHASVAVPAPAVVKATGPKKGVAVWSFTGVDQALAQSGATWYYSWSTQHNGIGGAPGVGFVPQIWGAASVTAPALAQAKTEGPYLLGFNEPDMSAQSNMTVTQALNLWPQLMSTGLTLGSPAVAYGAATPGGWLDQFMAGAKTKGYRVDFIALHWYGSDFVTADAVSQLKSYLQAVYDRYHLPIWLTEYALIDFSHGQSFPPDAQQAAFVTASTHMLTATSYLQRYAWFALPASDTSASSGLFRSGPAVTPIGRAFEAAPGG